MSQCTSRSRSKERKAPDGEEDEGEMRRGKKRRRSYSPPPPRRSALFRTPSPKVVSRTSTQTYSYLDTSDSDVELVTVKKEPGEDDSQDNTSGSSYRPPQDQKRDKGKKREEVQSDPEEEVKPDIKPDPALLAAQENAALPPTGTPRRKKADRILAAVPDVHPAYVMRLLNDTAMDEDVEGVVAELLTADYPLAFPAGSWKLGGVRPLFVAEGSQGEKVEVECQSCFDKVKSSVAARCKNGHAFCEGCTLTAAENALGMKRGVVDCFAMNSGCTETIATGDLKRLLPRKLIRKLEVVETENELDAAGLDGLYKCPFCPFAAIIDDRETVFTCKRTGCKKVSCRLCGKEDHGARPCNGTKLDGLAGQHAVEEAMSAAVIRKCVQCKLPYIKTDGCNKITCFACGTRQCYICEKRVSAAWHWSEDANWRRSGKCPANDDTDSRAYAEAESAKAHTVAALARSGAAPLPAASTSSLGPSRPERTAADAHRFRNGRHVFRGQDASLDARPDWMPAASSPSENRRLPSSRRRAPSSSSSTGRVPFGTPISSLPRATVRDLYHARTNADGRYANDLDAAGYGLKTAGNGVFGGGGWGGGRGGGTWSGGMGTRADEERERERGWGGRGLDDGGGARDEPEEVKRQRMFVAAKKREEAARMGQQG
ncbi:hypothetical protein JCM6882_005235 [Rhodosporidiobolus microsporus]